mmetsp:Transcript_39186/g.118421  ORF Transcript_39186/g.118421 Transcript_39186/m.118421 type:complete len:255 (+) Transcript_39186:1001-1765(+)
MLGQSAPGPRGGRQDVQDEVWQPRHESAVRGPAHEALLHHAAEPRVRRRHGLLAGGLDAADGERQRREQRGHHPPDAPVVLRAVPPGGPRRAHRHGLPLPHLRAEHHGAGRHGRDHDPVLPAGAPAEGLGARVGWLDHRAGRRVRLLGQPGDQGPARVGGPEHPDQPEHRDGADVGGLRGQGVFLASERGLRHAGHPAGAAGRRPVHVRRPDGAELRGEAPGAGRLREVWRARHGHADPGHRDHGGPGAFREGR